MQLTKAVKSVTRSMIYRFAPSPAETLRESLCKILHEDPVVRVPEADGVFCVDARSDIFRRLWFNGSYEPHLMCACKKWISKNRDVIDIGANVGIYTVYFSRHVKEGARILAFEPTAAAHRRLLANLERNDATHNTIVFAGAASDHCGTIKISVIDGKEEYSSIGGIVHPSVRGVEAARHDAACTTVDHLVKSYGLSPGFVKIDVEGAEFQVLKGMTETLKQHRPVILSEFADSLLEANGSSEREVTNLIHANDYVVYRSSELLEESTRRVNDDLFCFPRELAPSDPIRVVPPPS